jgi:NO-binding membrane sensor protein with MHYT domain/nitrogen-specific signal transduction histidine kinase
VPGYYDLWTVFCSFLIACLAGFVAFESIDHARHRKAIRGWVFFGGVTLGLGIWSMHFMGMLAWHPPFDLYYSVGRTLFSVLVAICTSWLALHLVAENPSRRSLTAKSVGALLVGCGICAMHYIGMSALHFTGRVMWDRPWLLYSFLIAVIASWVAMEMLDRSGTGMKNLSRRLIASVVIAIAICGMHYSGMRAFMLEEGSVCVNLPASFSGVLLARVGVGNAILFTFGLLIVSYQDKMRWFEKASEALRQAHESARKLEGLATAGKIAASVAHEINNPLEALVNLHYLIQSGSVGDAEREYLTMAQKELERISAITTHTLRFYRQQSSPALVSIPELFESALTLFQSPLSASNILIERRWLDDVPQVVCMEGEIRQVLANLISNAIDSMPNGGTLHLSAKAVVNGLNIEISDTGLGIPTEVHNKIMEPFFTTKGRKGTGLGLTISAEIIARHGGTLNFDTTTDSRNSGTCFQFFLPFKQMGAEITATGSKG